jgi:hypothetical protein
VTKATERRRDKDDEDEEGNEDICTVLVPYRLVGDCEFPADGSAYLTPSLLQRKTHVLSFKFRQTTARCLIDRLAGVLVQFEYGRTYKYSLFRG